MRRPSRTVRKRPPQRYRGHHVVRQGHGSIADPRGDPANNHGRGLCPRRCRCSTRSEAFRVRWAAHDVRLHRTGLKHVHHPVVGDLHLSYEAMDLPADPGLTLLAFSAEAGSPNDDALRLLASWAATHDPADALSTPNQT